MGCVNKNNKEFKALAAKHGIDRDLLALITYQYWADVDSESFYPTDVYIQTYLGNSQYIEPDNSLYKPINNIWEASYSQPLIFNSETDFKAAQSKALKLFPPYAVVSYKNDTNQYVLAVRKPALHLDDTQAQLFEGEITNSSKGAIRAIEQGYQQNNWNYRGMGETNLKTAIKAFIATQVSEELAANLYERIDRMPLDVLFQTLEHAEQSIADYKLVQEKLDSRLKKTTEEDIPQFSLDSGKPYQFNDGTVVTSPFTPNSQQRNALEEIDSFIKDSKSTVMTLSGYAGTGKTSIMEMIAQKMRQQRKPIIFCASTNKAAAVLGERVRKQGYTATTLNKIFGINVEVDSTKDYDAKNLVTVQKDTNTDYGSVIVIDEASMINQENYDIIKKKAKEDNLKIIFVGDEAQLAPVKDAKLSPVFTDSKGKIVRLTKVERTGDNAILKEATDLRNGKALSKESSFNEDNKGVAYVEASDTQAVDDIIKHYVPGLRRNSDSFRILAFTNEAVQNYNDRVRQILGYDTAPQPGEPMVGYTNFGYHWDKSKRTGSYDLINSEAYKVSDVGAPVTVTAPGDNGMYSLEAVPITLRDREGKEVTFNFIDVKNNPANRAAATHIAMLKDKLWKTIRQTPKSMRASLFEQLREVERNLFVNDDITVGNRVMQSKVIDFGYAMTVHKSQGSTFTNVLMDDVDIAKAAVSTETVPLEGIEAEDLSMEGAVQQGPAEDVMLDLSGVPEESKAPNQRQQLEYVGMTRATDTVTVIANNVKKADSPLNHVSAETEASLDKAMVAELVGHLNQITPVFLREDMVKYLQSHNPFSVQQSIEEQQDMASIKEEAIKNGQIILNEDGSFNYALAPNGKKSNLNEKQWLQVRTKAFKDWFGDWLNDPANASKVVDENGEPLVVYHGTKESFTVFSYKNFGATDGGNSGKGFYFTPNKTTADASYGKNGNVMPVFLNIKTPFIDTSWANNPIADSVWFGRSKEETIAALNEQLNVLKQEGASTEGIEEATKLVEDFIKRYDDVKDKIYNKDGVVSYRKNGEVYEYVIKNPNQVKSATDNVGTFDSSNPDIQLFKTKEGEIYGFVDKDGNVYLDETVITPEHPIHEYTHLWDRVVAQKNPKLWRQGINLMKQIEEWNNVLNDPNYGVAWKAMEGMTESKLENLIASEVHARLVGRNGQQILRDIAKKKGAKDIIAKLKEWMLDVWKSLKETFGTWTEEDMKVFEGDVDKAIEYFNNLTMRDFATGVKLNAPKSISESNPQKSFDNSKAEFYSGAAKGSDTAWGEAARALGIKVTDYTRESWNALSQEWKNKLSSEYEEVAAALVRPIIPLGNKGDIEVRRDMMQADKADAIFAIGSVVKSGQKGAKYINRSNHDVVDGGTGYAVQRGIIRDIPVYVFDQSDNQWKIWNKDSKSFVITQEPTLTPHAATIGTRGINDAGKAAIDSILQKTVNHAQQSVQNISSISNKSAAYGVVIDRGLKSHYSQWQQNNPNGIIAYRVNYNKYNSPEEALAGRIGNPFSEGVGGVNKGVDTVQKFYDWLTTGNNFGEPKATEEYRQAIIQKILSTPANSPILYYTELNRPSHATVIGYLIANKQLIQGNNATKESGTSNQQLYSEDGGKTPAPTIQKTSQVSSETFYTQQEAQQYLKTLIEDQGVAQEDIKVTKNPGTEELDDSWTVTVTKKNDTAKQVESTQQPSSTPIKVSDIMKEETPIDQIPVEKPQKEIFNVELPNYLRTQETTDTVVSVNAEWKVELLQDLDEQLSRKSASKESIINEMQFIMKTKTEKEYKDSKKAKLQAELDEYSHLTEQINNLLEGEIPVNEKFKNVKQVQQAYAAAAMSAYEVRHVTELIMSSVSDIITRLQNSKGNEELDKLFGQGAKKFSKKPEFMTRREIVEAVGVSDLLSAAKKEFMLAGGNNQKETLQKKLIAANWDAVLYLGSGVFSLNEGFSIEVRRSKSGKSYQISDDPVNVAELVPTTDSDPDALRELLGDEREHYQIEFRTIDVMSSMSEKVRRALHECVLLDEDSNEKRTWGLKERVNVVKAVRNILYWTQGNHTLSEMVSTLEEKAKVHTWLNSLIEKLKDKNGEQYELQSQFFRVFQKHRQEYYMVQYEDEKYKVKSLNSNVVLRDLVNNVKGLYKLGNFPLLGKDNKVNDETLATLNNLRDTFKDSHKSNSDKVDAIKKMLPIFDITVDDAMIPMLLPHSEKFSTQLSYLIKDLEAVKAFTKEKASKYEPFAFRGENNIEGDIKGLLRPVASLLEEGANSAFFENGKMYQTYVTPSYTSKMMQNLRSEKADEFIEREWGFSEFFYNIDPVSKKKVYLCPWLNIFNKTDVQSIMQHTVELSFNKHSYMKDLDPAGYTLSVLAHYFSHKEGNEDMVPAQFRMPIPSNKPSSEFITFYSFRGTNVLNQTYKQVISKYLYDVFLQELKLINTIRVAGDQGKQFKTLTKKGREFAYLQFLNPYLNNVREEMNLLDTAEKNQQLASLLQRKANANEQSTSLTDAEEGTLMTLVQEAIPAYMNMYAERQIAEWEKSGILEAAASIENIMEGFIAPETKSKEEMEAAKMKHIKSQIENFLWNDKLATINILELTITTPAFYKNAEELQKRFAQQHSPGERPNVEAVDPHGNRVSDGYYRTVVIDDYETFQSNLITNLREVFQRKKDAAPENEKAQWDSLIDDLLREPGTHGKDDKGGRYWRINVTDAQGISSPSSYRKKGITFGKWTPNSEEIFENIRAGKYGVQDIQTAFQPLKPFVFTHLKSTFGTDATTIQHLPVPFQAKNAEYMLVMAGAFLEGETTSKPNLLRAIFEVMEDSAWRQEDREIQLEDGKTVTKKMDVQTTKGIDTIQFASAIKSGLSKTLSLNEFINQPDGEAKAKEYLLKNIYQEGHANDVNYYNDNVVVTGDFEDYCMQQEVPQHFFEHSQAHGSQERMIVPSDLPFYYDRSKGNEESNIVKYSYRDMDGNIKSLNAKEIRQEYENLVAAKIELSVNTLKKELKLIDANGYPTASRAETNLAIANILREEILDSPRYGTDLLVACSLDENGEFVIPKSDPMLSTRIAQLLNGVIKKRVNKQELPGGPIVQITNFGTSKQLHIRFNSKKGGLIPLESEYKASEHNGLSYKEYVKKYQAGVAYYEVMVPVWNNEIRELFGNPDGTINMEAIEQCCPEILELVSYRIPTEDKYSIAPCKIVGFIPAEAGEVMMLPYELTEIDDSDFDVDKRYVNRKDYKITVKSSKELFDSLLNLLIDNYKKKNPDEELSNKALGNLKKFVSEFLKNPKEMSTLNKNNQWLYKQYQKMAYSATQDSYSKKLDNAIVDITLGILTNPAVADQLLNPGGFDNLKKMGYLIEAFSLGKGSKESLENLSIDQLADLSYTDKDMTDIGAQIQFYKQNAAAASLIGVFAVNKVAHAILCDNGFHISYKDIVGIDANGFKLGSLDFSNDMIEVDAMTDLSGFMIGKILGSGVSASADAAKTPVLHLMNINMKTVNIFATLLRMGMPLQEACWFMSQPAISKAITLQEKMNLSTPTSLTDVMSDMMSIILKENPDLEKSENLEVGTMTAEEWSEALDPRKRNSTDEKTQNDLKVIDYKVLQAYLRLQNISDALRTLSFPTRFNSISNAVGPLIEDNLILEHKGEKFTVGGNTENKTGIYIKRGESFDPADINTVFSLHPVLAQLYEPVNIAKVVFRDMITGSNQFREVLAQAPSDISDALYSDRSLLSQFSEFYQSYMLVHSGFIKAEEVTEYINNFPTKFSSIKKQGAYSDNALVNSISIITTKKGRAQLSIKLTGEDPTIKENLKSAWIDLQKKNPQLSADLMCYCFFKGGIGFSPKTFMELCPPYVKIRLERNGIKYTDVYRNLDTNHSTIAPNVVTDQFVRNNADDYRLAPYLKVKNNVNGETLYTAEPSFSTYVKTSTKDALGNTQTSLWRLQTRDAKSSTYTKVKPLGNNGEYIEFLTNEHDAPLDNTTVIKNNQDSKTTVAPTVSEERWETVKQKAAEDTMTVQDFIDGLDYYYKTHNVTIQEGLEGRMDKLKENPETYQKHLKAIFEDMGIELNEQQAVERFKKLC